MMKYYAARLAETFSDRETALASVGMVGERSRQIITNAAVNNNEVMVVPLGGGKGVVLTTDADGRRQLWQTILGLATESRNETIENGIRLAEALNDGSTIAVFEWTPQSSSGAAPVGFPTQFDDDLGPWDQEVEQEVRAAESAYRDRIILGKPSDTEATRDVEPNVMFEVSGA